MPTFERCDKSVEQLAAELLKQYDSHETLVAHRVQSNATDLDALLAESLSSNPTESVAEFVKGASARTGEAVNVKRSVRFDAGANGQVGMYKHHNGKLASFDKGLVALHPDVGVGLDVG